MVVWGGLDDALAYLGDGGRYDPAADVWTPLPQADAPSPRARHTTVWTGAAVVVWGGAGIDAASGGGAILGDGAAWSPEADAWTPLPAIGAPLPRWFHTAVWTSCEMVVWGGSMPGSEVLATGGRWVP
jgi:hypothetical protein